MFQVNSRVANFLAGLALLLAGCCAVSASGAADDHLTCMAPEADRHEDEVVSACLRALEATPQNDALALAAARAMERAGLTDEAKLRYTALADAGNAEAAYRLALRMLREPAETRDTARVLGLLTRAADAGHGQAALELGLAHYWGNGVESDHAKAVGWFEKAAAQGLAAAQYSLAYMLFHGEGTTGDPTRAVALYRLAADQGDTDAMRSLAYMHQTGNGLPQDDLKEYLWLRKAAEAGDARVLLDLAEASLTSMVLPVPTDFEGSYPTDEEIVAGDPLLAADEEVVLATVDRSPGERLSEAVRWLERALAEDVPGAHLALGNLHSRGAPIAHYDPTLQDFGSAPGPKSAEAAFQASAAVAASHYRRAIEEGSVAARLNLARLLELGHGIPRDLEAALALYREADVEVFEGPARLGQVRVASAPTWDRLWEKHLRMRDALGDHLRASVDTIVVRPVEQFTRVIVSDPVGRRHFAGQLPDIGGYLVPPNAGDLILWPTNGGALSAQVSVEVGGVSVSLPSQSGAGLRLDAASLRAGHGIAVPGPDEYEVFPVTVPEETRATSRIALVDRAGYAQIYVASRDEVIGFYQELYEDQKFLVPNVDGLTLEVKASETSGQDVRLGVEVDGRVRFEVVARQGCVVRLELDPEALQDVRGTGAPPRDCSGMPENRRHPIFAGEGGNVLGDVAKAPDESIPGVIAGFLGINRGIALLQMQLGGRWDELLRANRILHDVEMREHGPNSLEIIRRGLDLAEAEARMGNLKAAQKLLEESLARLDRASYAPDRLRADAHLRFGKLRLGLGRYGEVEQFLMLAHAYQLRHNESAGRPAFEALPRIYDELAELSAKLRRYDEAIAYRLRSFALMGSPERAETFATEIDPSSIIPVVEWLRLTGREREASGFHRYLHSQAKREFARDLPEPLAFPLDLSAFEGTFGPVDRSSLIATAMANLGKVYGWMGRHDEALPLLRQMERTSANIYGENTPQASEARADVSHAQRRAGMLDQAVATARGAWTNAETYVATRDAVRQEAVSAPVDAMTPAGLALLEALHAADSQGNAEEAFGVAQRLQNSSTALAMQSFGQRLALESAEARSFLRRRQDLSEHLALLDGRLVAAASKVGAARDLPAEEALRDQIADAEQQIEALNAHRPAEVSAADELATTPAISAAAAGSWLAPDQLLISYLVFDEASFAWAVDHEGKIGWHRLPVSGVALEKLVAAFRDGLSPDMQARGARSLAASTSANIAAQLSLAHELHGLLMAPLGEALRGKRHLTIVANGVLTSVPFHALVSGAPDLMASEPWREARWLARDHAISLMPSVASLQTVGSKVGRSAATMAYLGVADPVIGTDLAPLDASATPTEVAQLVAAGGQGLSGYFRGGLADVGKVRLLPRLWDTAIEVRKVAALFGADGGSELLLGREATEGHLKSTRLDRFRVIHFATHGLVSGDIEGVAEPALVMTPPQVASEADDGLLTASEIARLELDADWVILSACNTAGGGRPEADALSGLARSFFHAGARSVLVSHWPVVSSAAVRLTTSAFDEMARDASVGRAEALRRAMLKLIDEGEPHEAHPVYWAPFVVVGEAGAS